MWEAKVRNQAVISALLASTVGGNHRLTNVEDSTIYSTGLGMNLRNNHRAKTIYKKGETYAKNQKSTEVHQ
jgi:hypothetical protein